MRERYSKPKMRPGDYLTAAMDFGEAMEECKQAILNELLPKLTWVCNKLINGLTLLKEMLEERVKLL